MKPIFIVSTYPSNWSQRVILNDCVDAINKHGYDILLVSHCAVEQEIVDKVRYFIYDSDNSFLPSEFSPYFYYRTASLQFNIYNAGHTLPICRNMFNGLGFAGLLGRTHFVFTESDVIFSDADFSRLESLLDNLTEENKKMIFFKPEDYRGPNGTYVYETLLFAGSTEYFFRRLVPPVNLEQWFDKKMGYTLEDTFYTKFSEYENDYVIINQHSSQYFDSSKVNMSRYGLLNVEMIYNSIVPSEPVLFINNALIEQQTKYVRVFRETGNDTEMIESLVLKNGACWFKSYTFDDSRIIVDVYDDEEYIHRNVMKTFGLKQTNNLLFKSKGEVISV